MQVALLTTSWPRDDADVAGRFLANQVERLRAAGVEVTIVAPRSALPAERARDGFRDGGLASGGGVVANALRRPWMVPVLLASMALAVRRAGRSADVVHANWLLTAPLAAFGRRPVVLTLHGSGTAGRFSDLGLAERHPRVFSWLVRRARVVVGVSQPLVEAALLAGAREAVEIPHGVDVPDADQADRAAGVAGQRDGAPAPSEATSGASRDRPLRLLFAGRLSPEKGLDVLVDALRGADGFELVVAGDGPERSHLAALGVEPLGFVTQDRLRELYREVDVVVLPSRSEGFGVVALEAMAQARPVVASAVGGLARLVRDGDTGLLVPPDDPDWLRAALERLRDDPDLRATLGRNAQVRARADYGWNRVTRAMVEAYARAAEG